MLDISKCEIIESRVANLSDAVSLVDEGSAMVHFLENGKGVVKPSTGSGTEAFAGFALGRPSTPGIVPYYESLTVPASTAYTVTLSKPMSGSELVVVATAANGTKTTLTAGAASNANEYSISNGVITVNSSRASQVLTVGYKYAISLNEARMRYSFNEFASANTPIPTIGVIPTGEVYISNFDIASDWASWVPGTNIKLGANGTVTLGGSGAVIPAVVSSVPGVDSAMLGLRVNMGN